MLCYESEAMKITWFISLGCLFVSLSSRGINNLDSLVHVVNFIKWPLDGGRAIYCHLMALDGARAPQNASSGFSSDLV